MPLQHERELHKQVVDYLRYQHPTVQFRTDFASGIKMTMGQARLHKRLQYSKSWPDLFIAQPGQGFGGLFIELKHPLGGHQPFLKDGKTLSKDQHIVGQVRVLRKLRSSNFMATFAVGFDQARALIGWYLGPTNPTGRQQFWPFGGEELKTNFASRKDYF